MHVLQNSNSKVLIDELGAEVKSITHKSVELIYQKRTGFWQRSSPVLFPIVGKLNGNQYSYKGKTYSMMQHGFARDSKFELIDHSKTNCCYRLKSSDSTMEVYPFPFELFIYYTLKNNGLETRYVVKSEEEIYYSIGAHPAFAINGDINQYQLRFSNDDEVSYEGLIDGARCKIEGKLNLDLSEELFKNDTLIFKDLKSNKVEVFQNGEYCFALSFDSPYFGIWKQKNAPFLCLEPWWGVADFVTASGNILEKEGIEKLETGKTAHRFEIVF